MFGVADQVDQNLQYLMTLRPDQRQIAAVPYDFDFRLEAVCDVDIDRIFQDVLNGKLLRNSANAGVRLLH